MEIIKNKISLCEKAMQRDKSFKLAVLTANRYYCLYVISNEEVYLQKAYFIIAKSYSLNPSNVNLLLYKVFFSIEMKNTDAAEIMLTKFKPYANFYKVNNGKVYATYLFLLSLLGFTLEEKNLKKNIVILEELSIKYNDYIYDQLLSIIHLKLNNINKSYTYLETAYSKGSRSIFIYTTLYQLVNKSNSIFNDSIMVSLLTWLYTNKVIKKKILNDNIHSIKRLTPKNLSLIKLIYLDTKLEWLLKEICISLISNKDYTKNSYKYFKEAEQKQIYIQELNQALITSAYMNDIEDISRYSMELYIKNNNIPTEIKPFIYHNLLTKKKLYDLIDIYNISNYILDFAVVSIMQNFNGRYYNSIYRYALEHLQDKEVDLKLQIETQLYNNLFTSIVDIINPKIGFVWVKEKEKKVYRTYKVINSKCKIDIYTPYFKVIFFNNDQTVIIEQELVLKKEIENADIWLYEYFIKRGYKDKGLFISISSYYISNSIHTNGLIDILNKTITLEDLSQVFIHKISATLGNILFLKNRFDNALEYYNKVAENYLSEQYIEIMLKVFINTSEYDKSIRLIKYKSQFISEETIFTSLKTLSKYEDYQPIIANNIYSLLVKGWFDPNLLSIVLKFYNGSQRDWIILNNALTKMSIVESKLDEIILESTIWMHNFNITSQTSFIRMYNHSPNSPLIKSFVYYTCFEVLTNYVLPEHEMILTLEIIYEQRLDKLLAYSLSNIYLHNNITTDNSEKIIKDTLELMEQDDFILPTFKLLKNKSLITAYLEKNQSFVYKSSSGKKVYVFYRLENELEFIKIPMKYFKFGIYLLTIPVFYNEKIIYYFSEDTGKSIINTEEYTIYNNIISIKHDTNDKFFHINNALIYQQMFKYDEVDNIITILLKPVIKLRGRLL